MLLVFPVFKGTPCVSVTACGQVRGASRELLKWMDAQKPLFATIRSGSERAIVRVSFGGGSANHLHIDVTKQSMYLKPFKPKNDANLADVQKAFARFAGLEVEADLTAQFNINLRDLPDGGIIRSLFFQTKTGDVAIKVAGALLSITGAPVNLISWRVLEGNRIGITIESYNVKTKVAEDYLTTAFRRLESALNVFVLARTANEPKI